MEINKENWNNFILANGGSFLQSFEWGEFQENFGRKVFRIKASGPPSSRLRRDSGVTTQAQFIEMTMPIIKKKYWYCPKGPIFENSKTQISNSQIQNFIKVISGAAMKEGVMFFRIGPEWEISERHPEHVRFAQYKLREGSSANAGADELRDSSAFGLRMTELLGKEGFRQIHYDIEPSQTLILDITKSEEELLAEMHEKWRYNIRLAERKGVIIKNFQFPISNFQFDAFWNLIERTAGRKGIKYHPKDYYRKQLEINSDNFKTNLFVAEYENKIIAANIVVFFLPVEALAKAGGKTPADAKAMAGKATYLHGATDNNFRNVMAPHLLQWEQIKYAKQLGCLEYDFFGIVNEHTLDKRGASWEGFTRFKKGFGGREVNYIGYWDYPLDKKWYWVYRLAQKFRR